MGYEIINLHLNFIFKFCFKYFIKIGVGPTEAGHLDTPHLNPGTADICSRNHSFIRHLKWSEEMVIEVTYPNDEPSSMDIFGCGIYYHCEVNKVRGCL